MLNYYQNIGSIEQCVPVDEDGMLRIPQPVLDASPLKINNIPPDEIVYASQHTVMRDLKTNIMMIDSFDVVLSLPTSEWNLMSNPALMRVVTALGGKAIDGYLLDYRRIALPTYRDARLEYGTDNSLFEDLQTRNGTVFPLGMVLNNAGLVQYKGHPELLHAAADMIRRVDVFVESVQANLVKYNYAIPVTNNAILRPEKRLAITEGGKNEDIIPPGRSPLQQPTKDMSSEPRPDNSQ